ncbi:MAG: hypothetical protein RLP44_11825 [Aggregatilineales bacterium]
MRRPYMQSYDSFVSQQTEESFNMLSRSISVDYEVSIQGMLRLDDTDNILISRNELLKKYHDMLLSRLSGTDIQSVKIHVRPALFNLKVEQYVAYMREGLQVVLWHDDTSLKVPDYENLTLVRTKPQNDANREGFLVIKTATSSRILATWQVLSPKLAGVMVTNPRTVQRVSDWLDGIIQSAAR